MNVKVIVIVVFVVVLALLGAPLVLGALNGNLGQPAAKAQSNAEWTDAKLAGTKWGAVHTEAIPEFIGTGVVTVDVTITFKSGGTFAIEPNVTFSADTPDMVKNFAKNMVGQIEEGKWALSYPKLTLTMPDQKGAPQSVEATIQGDTISGPNLIKPGAEPLTLTRRYI